MKKRKVISTRKAVTGYHIVAFVLLVLTIIAIVIIIGKVNSQTGNIFSNIVKYLFG